MTLEQSREFIEEMGKVGDEWTEEQVMRTYGDMTLEDALATRYHELELMADILVKATLAANK